ncbi:conserved hypothetical protein [Frankia sp. AiPs1]|uniref:hypothetical protein n=1 Tax=Frankia sp. AiPa1 TaxID=573492 RepID=UPI00202B705E|nr:hypothetical protein [Frankia sp. AiPa1]MCL9761379.1 hypothetical protein [Frankia sp. AiPa1]
MRTSPPSSDPVLAFDRTVAIADAAIYQAGVGQADQLVADPVDGPPGVLAPPAQAMGHPRVRALARTECQLDAAPDAVLRVRARWLQLTTRAEEDDQPPGTAGHPPWLADVAGGAGTRGRAQDRRDAFIPHDVEERVPLWVLLAARPTPPRAPLNRWSRGWLPHPSAPRPQPWEAGALTVAGRRPQAGRAHIVRLTAPAGRHVRPVLRVGAPPTRVAWDTWSQQGELRLSAGLTDGPDPLVRLRIELVNTSGWHPRLDGPTAWSASGARPPGDHPVVARAWHERALRHALIGAHIVLGLDDGRFVPEGAPCPADPYTARTGPADGLWPILIGDPPEPSVLLLSPIRLAEQHAGT